MAKFDEIVKKATGGLQKGLNIVNEKAEEIASTASLNEQIVAADAEIQEIYLEVGRKAIELKAGIFANEAERIAKLEAHKEDCDRQLLAKKGLMRCPKCKEAISKDNKFCPECGIKIPVEEADETQE